MVVSGGAGPDDQCRFHYNFAAGAVFVFDVIQQDPHAFVERVEAETAREMKAHNPRRDLYYDLVTLTDAGAEAAASVVERHRALRRFLAGTDLTINLRANRLIDGEREYKEVLADLQRVDDRLVIRRLDAEWAPGLEVKLNTVPSSLRTIQFFFWGSSSSFLSSTTGSVNTNDFLRILNK